MADAVHRAEHVTIRQDDRRANVEGPRDVDAGGLLQDAGVRAGSRRLRTVAKEPTSLSACELGT